MTNAQNVAFKDVRVSLRGDNIKTSRHYNLKGIHRQATFVALYLLSHSMGYIPKKLPQNLESGEALNSVTSAPMHFLSVFGNNSGFCGGHSGFARML